MGYDNVISTMLGEGQKQESLAPDRHKKIKDHLLLKLRMHGETV